MRGLGNRYYEVAILLTLASLQFESGNFGRASDSVTKAVNKTGDDRNLLVHRARGLALRGDIHTAHECSDDPVPDYVEALEIANDEIYNQYIFEEIRRRINTRISTMEAEKMVEESLALRISIGQYLSQLDPGSSSIQTKLNNWISELDVK